MHKDCRMQITEIRYWLFGRYYYLLWQVQPLCRVGWCGGVVLWAGGTKIEVFRFRGEELSR